MLVRRYQRSPVRVSVEADSQASLSTSHEWVDTRREDRLALAAHYINCHGSTIVFCRTRRGADRVAKQLVAAGVTAVPIHGDRSQSQRDRALAAFSNGKAQALVATDVAARGIHVDSVRCVVHFDLAGTDKDYVHRSGRTGRAGADGVVVTLVTESDTATVRALQKALDHPISPRWGSRGLVQVRGRELAYTVGAGANGDTGPSSRPGSHLASSALPGALIARPNLPEAVGRRQAEQPAPGDARVGAVLPLERTTSAPGTDCLAGSGAGHRVASRRGQPDPGPRDPRPASSAAGLAGKWDGTPDGKRANQSWAGRVSAGRSNGIRRRAWICIPVEESGNRTLRSSVIGATVSVTLLVE